VRRWAVSENIQDEGQNPYRKQGCMSGEVRRMI
jgi:hypothetical protein